MPSFADIFLCQHVQVWSRTECRLQRGDYRTLEMASQRQNKTSDLAERPKMTQDPVIHASYKNRRCGVALRATLAQRFALSDISRHLVAALGSALGRSGMKVKLNDRLPQIREGERWRRWCGRGRLRRHRRQRAGPGSGEGTGQGRLDNGGKQVWAGAAVCGLP